MRELHLFAGAGGGILGGQLLGHTTVCAVEIESYCQQVLLQRQRDGILPPFPIWDNVCTFNGIPWRGRVDVVCGGFPCQDISAAGKGAGITGSRSGLWAEMARIIREVSPRFCFVENSPMLTSRGLGVVLGDLATLGYDGQWGVYGADDVGAPHQRKRIWILAHTTSTQRERARFAIGSAPRLAVTGTPCSWWGQDPAEIPESGVGRMVDGVANRTHRLKATGNGQVPAVAAYAFTRLYNAIKEM